MPSIRDVAREAGVSTATVSRAFSTPSLINAQTMERIRQAALSLDYQPARLRTAKSAPKPATVSSDALNAVGFQFFGSGPCDALASNPFYAPILQGAQEQASALGMYLLLHSTHREAFSQEVPRMVRDRVLSGLLLIGSIDATIISAFAEYVPHVLVVDSRDDSGRFDSVLSDGMGGAYTAMQYLFRLGHRERIAFVAPVSPGPTMQDRLRGYLCALFENGAVPDPRLVLHAVDADEERMAQIAALLQAPYRPTAILCANDYYAHIVLRVCRDLGLKIPGDLSLIGFDDIEYSSHCDPPLTTIRVDKEEMGRVAMRHLYSLIHPRDGDGPHTPERHELPVTLIVRESCRPL